MDSADLDPRVYWRLTDNWLELTVRFVTRERGVRAVKDAMSREILAGFEGAGPRDELQLQIYHTVRRAPGRRTAACVCPVRRLISPAQPIPSSSVGRAGDC